MIGCAGGHDVAAHWPASAGAEPAAVEPRDGDAIPQIGRMLAAKFQWDRLEEAPRPAGAHSTEYQDLKRRSSSEIYELCESDFLRFSGLVAHPHLNHHNRQNRLPRI